MVRRARARDLSWQDIGNILGISRQAAFRKYGSADEAPAPRAEASVRELLAAAEGIWAEMGRRNWGGVRAAMTRTAAAELTEEKLANVWLDLVEEFGEFVGAEGSELTRVRGMRVVASRLSFGSTQFAGRIAYNSSRRITGLLLHDPAAAAADLPF